MPRPGVHWIEFVEDEERARKEPLALAAIQREFPYITYLNLRRVKGGRLLSHGFGPANDITREQRARIYSIIINIVYGVETECH
jgi:hypothetical protein